MLYADDWVCTRHFCQTCGEAANTMCVFCPVSYCEPHEEGKIKTRSFLVANYRSRHRVCTAHDDLPSNVDKTERRRSSKAKARRVPDYQDEDKTEAENPALVGIAASSITAVEHAGMSEVNESVTDLDVSTQKDDGDDDDGKVMTHQESEKPNAKRHRRHSHSVAPVRHIPSSDRPMLLRVRLPFEKKIAAAKLRKKNGIVRDMVEPASLTGCESTVEQGFCQIFGEKPGQNEEVTDPVAGAEKSPSKHCWPPVLNGLNGLSVVSTRQRSTLQENSQALNVTASRLDAAINCAVDDTFSTLIEKLSDSKDLELVNGKEVVVDVND